MTYRIVGADGQTYGPAGPEEIRRWIAQGRAEARTLVLPAGAASWTYLGRLPEFAAGFAGGPASGAAGAPAGGTNRFALAGLVCGLLSWSCCGCCPVNVLGVVFSILALWQLRSPVQAGRGMAIAGLVLSVTSLLFGILAALLQLALNPAWTSGSP